MKCGVKYCKMVYPFIHVYVNDRIAYSILETEFRTMNYEDFMNILLKCTSNDFVDSYFRSQKIQMNLGDYGL